MTPVKGPAYEYRATLHAVIDGDTLDLRVDLGFEASVLTRVRLIGLNTPETVGKTKAAGLAAKVFVTEWFAVHVDAVRRNVLIRTYAAHAKEKYGRWLAEVWALPVREGAPPPCLNQDLLDHGLAVPMNLDGSALKVPK